MGSYLVDLSDDAWQSGIFNGSADLGSMFIWVAAGVLVIGGAMAAMFIFLSKKK